MPKILFEWDQEKDLNNQKKHGINFTEAIKVFEDSQRIIAKDLKHSDYEDRFYCIGKVKDLILTVRYTYRKKIIRIFGAGYWRQGKAIYEKNKGKIHS